MPCYLKEFPIKVVWLIGLKYKEKGKALTKAQAKAALKEALKSKMINAAQYNRLVKLVDACVESKAHEHEHELLRGGT